MRYREPFTLYKRRVVSRDVYYYRVYTPEGDRRAFSTGCDTKTAARAYCRKLDREGKLVPSKAPTFSEFATDWFIYDKCPYIRATLARGGSYSRNNADIQRGYLRNHIFPVFGECRLDKITPADVEKWLFDMKEKGASSVAVNHRLRCLKTIFQYAERLKIIQEAPTRDIKPLRNQSRAKGILTPPEVKALFVNPKIWNSHLMYTANLLAVCTGMRMGEIQALHGENVYPEYIHVCQSLERNGYGLKSTKTGRTRDIPIPRKLFNLLDIARRQTSGFIFSIDKGKTAITHKIYSRNLYKALDRINIGEQERKIRNITFHSHRHFFNSTLRAGGIIDSKLQSLTGHSSTEMVEHYTHFRLEDYQDVRQIQEEII